MGGLLHELVHLRSLPEVQIVRSPRDRETERAGDYRQTDRQRERDRHTDRERETDIQTERERQRDRERGLTCHTRG